MKVKQKKGISLIVLVITIIVMIILAAAIILSLQGSGIISKANEAKTSSDEANIKQAASLAYAEYVLDLNEGKIAAGTSAEEYVKEKLDGQFTTDELTNLNVLEDGTIQILPTIPTGFTVSRYDGEQKISDGLVVYKTDAETLATKDKLAAQKAYDQYVWVPVNNINEFVTSGNATEPYSTDTYTSEVEEYAKMRASVQKNGGFYIARYESGKEDGKVVSKKEAAVWNNVDWGESMTEIGTTEAVYLSRNIYPESGTSNVVSTLCYGVQWDAVMNFMKDVQNPYVEGKKYIEDSTGMGWYDNNYSTGNPDHQTGIDVDENASNMVKNIYDMAGNLFEWTMEAASADQRVIRGGIYAASGVSYPASVRFAFFPDGGDYGFRPVLYLK